MLAWESWTALSPFVCSALEVWGHSDMQQIANYQFQGLLKSASACLWHTPLTLKALCVPTSLPGCCMALLSVHSTLQHLARPPMILSSIHKTWTTKKAQSPVAGPELCMGFKHVNECGRHYLDDLLLHRKNGQSPHKLQIYCHSKEQWNMTIRRFISHYLLEASTVYIERRKQGGGWRKKTHPYPSKILLRGFAVTAFQLQIRLIKIKLLSLLTQSKFHELQFV